VTIRQQDFIDGEGRFLDLYGLLGVSHRSGADKIKKALRTSRLISHPDVTPEDREWAQRHHRKINLAEEVLLDEGKRAEYDALYLRYVEPGTEALKEPRQGQPEKKVSLRIRTQPVEGAIYLDGTLVACGTFSGKRPAKRSYTGRLADMEGWRAPAEETFVLPEEGLEKTYTYARKDAGPARKPKDALPLRKAGLAVMASLVLLAMLLFVARDCGRAPATPSLPGTGGPLETQRAVMERSREEYYLERGRDAFRAGDYPECLRNMQRAVELNDRRPESYYYAFRSFAALGQRGRAEKAARAVVRLAPDSPWAGEARAYLGQ